MKFHVCNCYVNGSDVYVRTEKTICITGKRGGGGGGGCGSGGDSLTGILLYQSVLAVVAL